MKNTVFILSTLLIILLSSCSNSNVTEANTENAIEVTDVLTTSITENAIEVTDVLTTSISEDVTLPFSPNLKMKALFNVMQKSKNVLLKKHYPEGGFQVVFVENSKRYTIYCSEDTEDKLHKTTMSFWVRPNGTFSQKEMITFTDTDFDGNVDFGITGKGNKSFIDMGILPEKEGLQHREQWQEELEIALNDAYKHFNVTG